jgi:hypothetical protein
VSRGSWAPFERQGTHSHLLSHWETVNCPHINHRNPLNLRQLMSPRSGMGMNRCDEKWPGVRSGDYWKATDRREKAAFENAGELISGNFGKYDMDLCQGRFHPRGLPASVGRLGQRLR